MVWTEESIRELIACPKTVMDSPKELTRAYVNGGMKKTFSLASIDGAHAFSGFIMQNKFFAENFSIGLIYQTQTEKGGIVLLRCNGKHGGTKENPHHAGFHVHYATADRINAGLKPEGRIEYCSEYASLEEALVYFVDLTNVSPGSKHLIAPARKIQLDIFENEYATDN